MKKIIIALVACLLFSLAPFGEASAQRHPHGKHHIKKKHRKFKKHHAHYKPHKVKQGGTIHAGHRCRQGLLARLCHRILSGSFLSNI